MKNPMMNQNMFEVAEMLKTKHNFCVISNNLDIEKIISAIENYDEPFAAPSLLPTCGK